jgi:hypothetical protein
MAIEPYATAILHLTAWAPLPGCHHLRSDAPDAAGELATPRVVLESPLQIKDF